LAAAVSDFEEYFEATATARKLAVKRGMQAELTKLFISSLRKAYASTRDYFITQAKNKPLGNDVRDGVISYMKTVFTDLTDLSSALRTITGETVQISSGTSREMTIESVYKHEALVLGMSMGNFLAVVNYGIANMNLSNDRENITTTIMDLTEKIRLAMRSLGHGVRTTYIAHQIKKIARKKPFLSKDNQKLLAMIASELAAK